MDEEFERRFGGGGAPIEVRAPGRVNLIGEHTDYNDGFVLPMAIGRETTVLCRARQDTTVRVASMGLAEIVEFSVADELERGSGWGRYARGMAEALRRRGKVSAGIDALVSSTVPMGGGLSSSAALEIAIGGALLAAGGAEMSNEELALAGQWAEHEYAGMPCGIMDQYICAMGRAGHAMLLDCRDRAVRHVAMPAGVKVVVADSGVKHEHAGGEYAARRRSCQEAVEIIRRRYPEVKSLRDVTADAIAAATHEMEDATYWRAWHVISENRRVLEFVDAMERGDFSRCGELMARSHVSLRDDFQVSCREVDALVEIARAVEGVYGARMTGGGFGGCVVALVRADAGERAAAAMNEAYQKKMGLAARAFVTGACNGSTVVRGGGACGQHFLGKIV